MRCRAAVLWNKMVDGLTVKKILLILLGAMICSFGIHNIHQRTNITEGGVIGLMLFAEHWLKLSPAYITPVLDIACYLLAFRFLGGRFIKISIISTFFVSLFYKIWELFPPMLPDLSNRPLIAAVLGGMFVGIGVGLQQTAGGVQIGEVMRYSAAEEAGLQIGDLIVKIDGEDVSGAETADVASRLRGQEGTTVSVTVRRQGRDITVSITRRQINQVYVSNSTLTQGVEYIKISSFASENDWQAFSEIWNGLAKKNTRAVVLDLRGNGGGLIDVAFKIANAMTPDKGVTLAGVRYRDDMGGLDETVSTGGGLPLNKIVVLVNGGTASAAELLTGILQDTAENVTVVGEKTYGKGQGQMHLPLINGDKLVITTLEMELPGQGCWEGRGLTPDIQVGNSTVSVREDALHALDTSRTMCFGEVSDNIYAMTERLQLLGLIGEPTNTFNGDVLDAVTGFCSSYDLPAAACASPEMLSALSDAISALSGKTYTLDMQMQSALEICRLAAAKPQQYTVSPDGTWKRNS